MSRPHNSTWVLLVYRQRPCHKVPEPQHPTDRASLWTVGDLCPDTPPTPVMFGCSKLPRELPLDCDGQPWQDPAVYNPMGFSFIGPGCCIHDIHCTARWQRWIDAVYGTWMSLTYNDLPGRGPPLRGCAATSHHCFNGRARDSGAPRVCRPALHWPDWAARASGVAAIPYSCVYICWAAPHVCDQLVADIAGGVGQCLCAKSHLVDGESHTFSVKTEGTGGICAIWGTDSNPVMCKPPGLRHPACLLGLSCCLFASPSLGVSAA